METFEGNVNQPSTICMILFYLYCMWLSSPFSLWSLLLQRTIKNILWKATTDLQQSSDRSQKKSFLICVNWLVFNALELLCAHKHFKLLSRTWEFEQSKFNLLCIINYIIIIKKQKNKSNIDHTAFIFIYILYIERGDICICKDRVPVQ